MKTKLEIIQLHLSGESNRKIAEQVGLNRKTVNKYVNEWQEAQAKIQSADATDTSTIRCAAEIIASAPAYKKRVSPHRKWNKEMEDFLDDILTAEEAKRIRLRTTKQQLRVVQIHAAMVDAGFDIGLTTVYNRVREKTKCAKEAFIAQSYEYGDRFEYDFGEVHVELAGKLTTLFMACMIAPASGYRYALLYDNQRFDVFADSQIKFFEHMGGTFNEGVYDNMRNVVSKFIGKNEKEINPRLLQLAAYYGFRVNVTNCYAGNEKGSVESSVKVIRNAAFAVNWQFDTIRDAQAYLFEVLDNLNANCALDSEKAALKPYMPPFEIADIRPGAKVDKYSCVHFDKVSYSVPDCLVGAKVTIKAYPLEIVVFANGQEVARHIRSKIENDMVLDLSHYIATLTKKPGALARSSALKANEQLKEIFESEYAQNPREFLFILNECKDLSEEQTIAALKGHVSLKQNSISNNLDDKIAAQTINQMKAICADSRSAA